MFYFNNLLNGKLLYIFIFGNTFFIESEMKLIIGELKKV